MDDTFSIINGVTAKDLIPFFFSFFLSSLCLLPFDACIADFMLLSSSFSA